MNIIVYVAGPYTKGDVAINVRNMIIVCNQVMEKGFIPYCPLLTHFWHLITPKTYEEWLAYDEVWLKKCDCILRMSGESSGADREVERMKELGRDVFYSVDDINAKGL